MFDTLPNSALDAIEWDKDKYAPYFEDLVAREVNSDSINQWLADWTQLSKLVEEVSVRIQVATAQNTADKEAEARFRGFMANIFPMAMTYDNQLNQKLLATNLEPEGMAIPLRNIRADAELFREENLPLMTEASNLDLEVDKITGSQTVEWEGAELTLQQLGRVFGDPDRAKREKVWRLMADRQLQDRAALNELWVKYMDIRGKLAENADMPDFRAYAWKGRKRFDYSTEDAMTFHRAIEDVVVPAAKRIFDRRRERLGVETLRPWDIGGGLEFHHPKVDPLGRDSLHPFTDFKAFEDTLQTVFNKVDPSLGAYFKTMRDQDSMDIENRNNKHGGAFCAPLSLSKRPFVFGNATGTDEDIRMMLHECGHAFHAFESFALPYFHQLSYPMEFAEVASMSMELLAAPYLLESEGGFYTPEEVAQSRVDHLEKIVTFWPFMAVMDAYQHWVYTHIDQAMDPDNCDDKWGELWDRFIPSIDYSGIDDFRVTGWHRKMHIFQAPFYYIEYGLAELGAVQVWANALKDQAQAVKDYRKALALGGTASIPDLFSAAGVKFTFDSETLGEAIDLIERTIDSLE
jgi:oligoendopeptidase F